MLCRNCGATLGEGEKFCISCGTKQTEDLPVSVLPVEQQPELVVEDGGAVESFAENPVEIPSGDPDESPEVERAKQTGLSEDVLGEAAFSAIAAMTGEQENAAATEGASLSEENYIDKEGPIGLSGIGLGSEVRDTTLEKPLYGYEPYRPEVYAKQEAQQVPQQAPQYVTGYQNTQQAYQSPAPGMQYPQQQVYGYPPAEGTQNPYQQQAYYPAQGMQNQYQQQTYGQAPGLQSPYAQQPYSQPVYGQGQYGYNQPQKKKMSGGKIALLVIGILLIVGIVIGGVIWASTFVMDSMKEAIGDVNPSDFYSNLPDFDSSFPEIFDDFSASGNYSSYESLLEDYFKFAESGDRAEFSRFLHQNVRDILEKDGILEEEFAEELDGWVDMYGLEVLTYEVTDVYQYDNSQYSSLTDIFGFDQGEIDQYADVEVYVELQEDEGVTDWYYDFDLIKVSGKWYILEIW